MDYERPIGLPKKYFICTNNWEINIIYPILDSIWTLIVESGFGCTSILDDKDDSILVYIATEIPSLIAVDPITQAISNQVYLKTLAHI